MAKTLSKFFILFGILLCTSYALHAGIKTSFFETKIPPVLEFYYKFNFGITFLFTTTIIVLSNRLSQQLGFIFLGGSAVKLAAFMFISNSKDFTMDKSVFLDFFIPYVLCVILEIYVVSSILKKI